MKHKVLISVTRDRLNLITENWHGRGGEDG